nr:phosphonates transport system permease protein phnE [Bradyrhizobium sp. DOA9]
MVLGLAQMAEDAGRDAADLLCRHADRCDLRLRAQLLRGREHLARVLAALRRAAPARIRPHRSRHRLCAGLRDRLRARTDGWRAGDCDPLDGSAGKTVLGDRRECRHEAGRGHPLDRSELALLHALRHRAAGHRRLCQLRAAALRDQRPRGLRDGLRRRRRHRPGARRRHPQVLLFGRQRHPAHHRRHRLHHRHHHRLVARPPVRQGGADVTPQEVDTAQIRARYPDVFDRPASARLATPAMIAAALAILVYGLVDLDFSPSRFFAGLSQLGWITLMMIPPDPGSSLPIYLKALGETLSIALLGTTLAAVFALPVSLLAARNIVPSNILRFPVRRFLDSIRGVDTLIWALVWINVVGLGPFAGVLAIAVSDFGAFGKLFSEAIEGADQKQVEGIRASGGSALHEIRFGLLPQVLPVIAGQVLYFIESNTRSATIIGIVGAGGIGLQLAEQIRVLEWQKVSFLILMILVAVAAIDFISGKLRFAIIGRRAVA